MIKKLTIQNFQSHKNTQLELDEGVNVIVGPTDSGKTAIIRALRWLVWNKPGGSSFRSTWGGATKVTAEFKSGEVVSREKDKSDSYQYNDLEFKAFGASTPEDIAKALNMSEVNLQLQLDKPFLLSDTPGQIAGYFNKIAGIDAIDKATKDIKKEIREINQSVSIFKDEIVENQEKLKKYDNLEEAEKLLSSLEHTEKQKIALIRRKKDLRQVIEEYTAVQELLGKKNYLIDTEKFVDKTLDSISKRKEVKNSITVLKQLISKIDSTEKTKEQITELLQYEEKVTITIDSINKRKQIKAKIKQISNIVTKYYTIEDSIKDTQRKQQDLQDLLDEQHIQICPFCGTKLKKNEKG